MLPDDFIGHTRRWCQKCGVSYFPKIERCACLTDEERSALEAAAAQAANEVAGLWPPPSEDS